MRMSCNGCRILRKGCSKDCTIRPCLEWLKNPQHQSNATFFLAKFYGRAGLINLINSGPKNLRPAIFRSLLYEACGRIVDPIYGSAGLLCSGSWELCQAAVESVLKGTPIMQISPGEGGPMMMNGCDIRHVARDEQPDAVQRVKSTRSRFKRSGHPVQQLDSAAAEFARDLGWVGAGGTEPAGESAESMFSDGSNGSGAEEGGELELELRLGIEPVSHAEEEGVHGEGHVKGVGVMDGWGGDTCHVELRLV